MDAITNTFLLLRSLLNIQADTILFYMSDAYIVSSHFVSFVGCERTNERKKKE
jgi:hypothetical protein